ncbi:MAG: hypothetical protein LBN00_12180 [Oscillospiraceae bacterium]|jgi:hypothetical protein|nr:hypothetical protein [Oscillospiraceae bacterium]
MEISGLRFNKTGGVEGCLWHYDEKSASGKTYGREVWERADMAALFRAVKAHMWVEAYAAAAFRTRLKQTSDITVEFCDDGVYLYADFDDSLAAPRNRRHAYIERSFVDWLFDENLKTVQNKLTELFAGDLPPEEKYDAALAFLEANGWRKTSWRAGERAATLAYNYANVLQLDEMGAIYL